MKNLIFNAIVFQIFIRGFLVAQEKPPKAGDLFLKPITFETREGEKVKVDAEEGILYVPESHAAKDGKLIQVRFIRFKTTTDKPSFPVVYLAGGPGGSGSGSAAGDRFPLFMEMRKVGDVIAYDQRGTFGTQPYLLCPEPWNYPLDQPLDQEVLIKTVWEWARNCKNQMQSQGIDLKAYNTEENANDLEMLRQALKAEKLNLLGISYGTHLGLNMIKRFPDSVAKAVLAGVEGTDHTLKLPGQADRMLLRFDSLFKASKEASALVPDFLGTLKKLFEKFEKEPVRINFKGERGKNEISITLGKLDLQYFIFDAFFKRESVSQIPSIVYQLENGKYDFLGPLAYRFRNNRRILAMTVSMDCASGCSESRWKEIEKEAKTTLLGNVPNFVFPEICKEWVYKDLGEAFRSPVISEVPVLFISGSLDVRTPFENAFDTAKGFKNHRHLLIAGGGHDDDLLITDKQIGEQIQSFFLLGKISRTVIQLPEIAFKMK